jgi:hypothetical protein
MKDNLTKERITGLFDEVDSAMHHEFVWPWNLNVNYH